MLARVGRQADVRLPGIGHAGVHAQADLAPHAAPAHAGKRAQSAVPVD